MRWLGRWLKRDVDSTETLLSNLPLVEGDDLRKLLAALPSGSGGAVLPLYSISRSVEWRETVARFAAAHGARSALLDRIRAMAPFQSTDFVLLNLLRDEPEAIDCLVRCFQAAEPLDARAVDAPQILDLIGVAVRCDALAVRVALKRYLERDPQGIISAGARVSESDWRHAALRAICVELETLADVDPAGGRPSLPEMLSRSVPFGRLRSTPDADLQEALGAFAPELVSIVLAHVEPRRAARLVETMPLDLRRDVIRRLASPRRISPHELRRIDLDLLARLDALREAGPIVGGPREAGRILSRLSCPSEEAILEGIDADDPDLADAIRREMFTFADMMRANDRGIQNLLKTIDTSRLALALKTAPPALRTKFFRNMSRRASEIIAEEMDFLGPVRLADVEPAQREIGRTARRLHEQGDLRFEDHGPDPPDEIVV